MYETSRQVAIPILDELVPTDITKLIISFLEDYKMKWQKNHHKKLCYELKTLKCINKPILSVLSYVEGSNKPIREITYIIKAVDRTRYKMKTMGDQSDYNALARKLRGRSDVPEIEFLDL